MKKQINTTIFLAVTLMLTACGNGVSQTELTKTALRTETQVLETIAASTLEPSVPTPSYTLVPATPSPQPTMEGMMTPDPVQLAKWMEYQDALAKKFIPESYAQGIAVLCEWVLLGQSKNELYVWAVCQASGSIPTSRSAPALIRLDSGGIVQGVETPRSGSNYVPDIRKLFPSDIQEKIFSGQVTVDAMIDHIYLRLEHPEPPLIVYSATPIP